MGRMPRAGGIPAICFDGQRTHPAGMDGEGAELPAASRFLPAALMPRRFSGIFCSIIPLSGEKGKNKINLGLSKPQREPFLFPRPTGGETKKLLEMDTPINLAARAALRGEGADRRWSRHTPA